MVRSCSRRFKRKRTKPDACRNLADSCFLGALSANEMLEKGPFVNPANKCGSAFAETYVTESTVDVERVEIMFEF